jgi:hypothetical protein
MEYQSSLEIFIDPYTKHEARSQNSNSYQISKQSEQFCGQYISANFITIWHYLGYVGIKNLQVVFLCNWVYFIKNSKRGIINMHTADSVH